MDATAHMTVIDQQPAHPYGALLRAALRDALTDTSPLPAEVLTIPGMSGRRYRHFINNLIRAMPDARYLEIGVWAGSTLCSAINGNKVQALAIDNWSQFGGPSREFFANLSRHKTVDARLSFIESDFRAIDFAAIGKFNIYLFDGPHDAADQRDGVVLAQPALEDQHVMIVDDWNWPAVRQGTMAGIRDARLTVLHSIEIRTTLDDSHPQWAHAESEWHNGYFIAGLTKS